jgi:hypothetical protein
MIIFEFIGQFYFQNDIFKLQKDFSELVTRVFLENGLESFQLFFLFYRFETNQRCKKDSKNRFEKNTQNQRNHIYFGFRKIRCGLIPKPLNKGMSSVFERFIEEYLRNLTCWEKSENRFGLSADFSQNTKYNFSASFFLK